MINWPHYNEGVCYGGSMPSRFPPQSQEAKTEMGKEPGFHYYLQGHNALDLKTSHKPQQPSMSGDKALITGPLDNI